MSTATLILRTGLQGHGKTLNTIKDVDEKAFKEGRPVYFHNVTDLDASKLKADWFHFEDAHKWFDLPENSIIVIDEAQSFFPVRDPRKEVPEYASRFETMRKHGHEVHLVTQDPRFIDVHVRRLCGCHYHYSRLFGSSKIARYYSNRVFNEVEKIAGNKSVDMKIIQLDKSFFGVYSSAQAGHHFKFKPSRKLVIFCIVLIATLWFGGRIYFVMNDTDPSPENASTSVISDAVQALPISRLLDGPGGDNTAMTKAEYLAALQPRIADVPSSAPVYDGLTEPQSHPRLFCVLSTDSKLVSRTDAPRSEVDGVPTSCQCYTQQATRVETTFGFCLNAVNRGYFDNTRPDIASSAQSFGPPAAHTSQFSASSSGVLQSTPDVSRQVVVVPYEKGQFLW